MFLKIDGTEIAAPIKYDVGIMDINKAGRNAAGNMVIDRITTKRKIELSLKFLSPGEVSIVLNAVAPVLFEVEYHDPQTNGIKTGVFYAGDRKTTGLRYSEGKLHWDELSFNIIER